MLEGKSLFDHAVIDRFGDTLKELLFKRLKQEDRKPTLRMSNVGKPLRQLYYELTGVEGEKISGKTLVKFMYGDLTEALIIALADAAGHVVSRFQEEVEVDGVKGHIDLVLSGVLVDVKSCSSYSFNKFKDGTLFANDPFGYIGQLCGYASALNLPAAWVAIDKTSGEICVLHLPKETVDDWDVRSRIKEIYTAIAGNTEPERCYPDVDDGKSGNKKLGVSCSYCSFKHHCWRDSNGGEGLRIYQYSTGPRFLTNVSKEPRVNAWPSNFPTKNEEEGTQPSNE